MPQSGQGGVNPDVLVGLGIAGLRTANQISEEAVDRFLVLTQLIQYPPTSIELQSISAAAARWRGRNQHTTFNTMMANWNRDIGVPRKELRVQKSTTKGIVVPPRRCQGVTVNDCFEDTDAWDLKLEITNEFKRKTQEAKANNTDDVGTQQIVSTRNGCQGLLYSKRIRLATAMEIIGSDPAKLKLDELKTWCQKLSIQLKPVETKQTIVNVLQRSTLYPLPTDPDPIVVAYLHQCETTDNYFYLSPKCTREDTSTIFKSCTNNYCRACALAVKSPLRKKIRKSMQTLTTPTKATMLSPHPKETHTSLLKRSPFKMR